MNRVLSILSVVLLIGVAACSEEEETTEQSAPTSQSEPATTEAPAAETPAAEAPTTQAPATQAPAAEAPAAEAPATQAPASGDTTSGDTTASEVSDAAINACLSAVRQETGEADVAVLSTEFSEANSLVMIGVGAQRAPWKCLVSNDGQVAGVSFAGDEGKL